MSEKAKPRRTNKKNGRHNPWTHDPCCYGRSHKGAAMRRKGYKEGTTRVARHQDNQKVRVKGADYDERGTKR